MQIETSFEIDTDEIFSEIEGQVENVAIETTERLLQEFDATDAVTSALDDQGVSNELNEHGDRLDATGEMIDQLNERCRELEEQQSHPDLEDLKERLDSLAVQVTRIVEGLQTTSIVMRWITD